ncbi:MAG TPA: VOC family protein [Burkholderiales bacterium]|nr:VOC family protein [Burkholderiales bacterium]
MLKKQRITPFLWFDGQAEEAAKFYTAIFAHSRIGKVARYPKGSPGGNDGKVMTVEFQLDGQPFVALNGGPQFRFNESISFHIACENQDEVDYYWERLLTGGGKPVQCGWLKDRYGVPWQVVPTVLEEMLTGPDSGRVMKNMLQMVKIDIKGLTA